MIQFVLSLEIIFFRTWIIKIAFKRIKFVEKEDKAVVFGYGVKDPERYGVVSFDHMGQVKKIVEKPKSPDSIYAVVGLYFYPNDVIDLAKSLDPSEEAN